MLPRTLSLSDHNIYADAVKSRHAVLLGYSYNICSLASVFEMPGLPLSPSSQPYFWHTRLPKHGPTSSSSLIFHKKFCAAFTAQHDLTGLYLIQQIFIWHLECAHYGCRHPPNVHQLGSEKKAQGRFLLASTLLPSHVWCVISDSLLCMCLLASRNYPRMHPSPLHLSNKQKHRKTRAECFGPVGWANIIFPVDP